MDMDHDHLTGDFSREEYLDLAMLPPCENADVWSDQDSNSSDDINEGLAHHLLMHLLNSARSTNTLVKNCDSSTAQKSPTTPQKEENEAQCKKMKNQTRYQFLNKRS